MPTAVTSLKVAAVQTQPLHGQVSENVGCVKVWLAKAADAGAQLAIFPECALTGYVFDSRADGRSVSEPVPGPSTERLIAACAEVRIFAVVGLIERTAGQLFNTAVVVGPGGLIARYRKVHLPRMGVDRFLDAGDEPFSVVSIPEIDLRLGLQICYDGSFPEPARVQALLGADLIALPTNWPAGAEPLAEHLMPARSIENVVYSAAVNRVGCERGVDFIGRSSIHDPFGRTLSRASCAGEEMIVAEIDPALARRKRILRAEGSMELNRIADRRPEFYGAIAVGNAAE